MRASDRDASWSGVSAAPAEEPLRFSARGRPLYTIARAPSGASSPLRGGYDSDYWSGSPSGSPSRVRAAGGRGGPGRDPTYHGVGTARGEGRERVPRPPREPGPPQPKKSHTGKGKEGLPHRKGVAQLAEAAAQAAAEAALREAAGAQLAEDEAKAAAEKAAREAIAAVAADFRRGGKYFRSMPAVGKRKSEQDRLAGDGADADKADVLGKRGREDGDGSDGSKPAAKRKKKAPASGKAEQPEHGGTAAGLAAAMETAKKRGRAPSRKVLDAVAASPSAPLRVRNAGVVKRKAGMSLAEAAAAAAAEKLPVGVSVDALAAAVAAARKPKAVRARAGVAAAPPAPGRRGRSAAGQRGSAVIAEVAGLLPPMKKGKAAAVSVDTAARSLDALQQLPIKKRKALVPSHGAEAALPAAAPPAGPQRNRSKPAVALAEASKPARRDKQAAKASAHGKPCAAKDKLGVKAAISKSALASGKGLANAAKLDARSTVPAAKLAKGSSKAASTVPKRRGRSGS